MRPAISLRKEFIVPPQLSTREEFHFQGATVSIEMARSDDSFCRLSTLQVEHFRSIMLLPSPE